MSYNERGVAIVGLACRLPGANDVAAFWMNLISARESVRHFSDDELRAAGAAHHCDPHKTEMTSQLPSFDMWRRFSSSACVMRWATTSTWTTTSSSVATTNRRVGHPIKVSITTDLLIHRPSHTSPLARFISALAACLERFVDLRDAKDVEQQIGAHV